ncbi:MAG: ATP-dependent helicase DinG [Acidimicrobiaceae bacterium]|nr:ATP-dependent helicase DinG [Acidimicrobiaceae bacterium]
MTTDEVAAALDRVVGGLPGGGDSRPGQRQMAAAVARAIAERRHLIVGAQTGTGKSLAYLVPALLSGSRVVVATATKALQDQLAKKDLPFLAERLAIPFEFAVLKGRSNYLCRQRALEVAGAGDQLELGAATGPDGASSDGAGSDGPGFDGAALGAFGRQVRRLIEWSMTAETGDRADLPFEPQPRAWAMVSVSSTECPGANRCPSGDVCFAEAARAKAALADVVVVNTHLYATHLASAGAVLPPHDVVIFDEAHELEDVASSSLGLELVPGRFFGLARNAKPLITEAAVLDAIDDGGTRLSAVLDQRRGQRLAHPLPEEVETVLTVLRERVARVSAALRQVDQADSARKARAQESAGHLASDLDQVLALPPTSVAWIEGPAYTPVLKVAPIDIAPLLTTLLWQGDDAPTAVLTSATIPPKLATRLGIPVGSFDELDVGSPFDYPNQALLYCALHLPDPRTDRYEAAMHTELEALVRAAGGRTLGLFTSWRAMEAATKALREVLPWPIFTQSDLPKPLLIQAFKNDERSCLFATMGFWQGVDIPGRALSLVAIDRIPFPRPDEPLLQARRELLGRAAFGAIDLPRAATLLAQGAGRLIRSPTDRGVVAILDPRLATARYRWDLVRALPPMRRTRHRREVEDFLADLRT